MSTPAPTTGLRTPVCMGASEADDPATVVGDDGAVSTSGAGVPRSALLDTADVVWAIATGSKANAL